MSIPRAHQRLAFLLPFALLLMMGPLVSADAENRNSEKEFYQNLVDQGDKASQRKRQAQIAAAALAWFLQTNKVPNIDPTDAEVDTFLAQIGPHDLAYGMGKAEARNHLKRERLHAALFGKYGGIQYPEQGFYAPYDAILMVTVDYLAHNPDQKVDAQDLRDILVCYQLDAFGLIPKALKTSAVLPH